MNVQKPCLGAIALGILTVSAGAIADQGSGSFEPAAAITGAAGRAPLFGVLVGGNEVTPTGAANGGDPDGYGSATVSIVGRDRICYGLTVANIDKPIAAHIHNQLAGINGGIVVALAVPPTVPGTSSGCVGNLDPALVNSLRGFPAAFYVNVHTGKFPGGAMRGQLF